MDVQKIHARGFAPDLKSRHEMWAILCRDFSRGTSPETTGRSRSGRVTVKSSTTSARNRIALDMNPEVRNCAAPGSANRAESQLPDERRGGRLG